MNNSPAESVNSGGVFGVGLALIVTIGSAFAAPVQHRLDPELQEQHKSSGVTDVVIEFESVPVSRPPAPVTLESRRAFIAALKARAAASQRVVAAKLAKSGIKFRSFWISNSLAVALPHDQLASIASSSSVKHVHVDRKVTMPPLRPELDKHVEATCEPLGSPTWGVARVRAPDVWNLGFSGQGVTVAGADTGYQWTHPALRNQYRGWNGSVADHNYHWWDGIRSGGNVTCAAASPAPCDDNNHGTHTMGSMVGDAGGGTVIGVAPGARWMGCRNMNTGNGTLSTYNECFQFFLEPTRLDGTAGDTAMAPDVVNNSWGCSVSEGCNAANFAQMESVINALDAAGILVVSASGNTGAECGTVDTPAAIFSSVLTVGNSNLTDSMDAQSSRGPVTVDGSLRLKPDISAPGTAICSSVPNDDYAYYGGSSMSAPNVVGVAALLISAYPAARGNPALLKEAILGTADPIVGISQTCGGIPVDAVPNNVGGYGRVNALAALQYLQALPPLELFEDSFE